MTKWELFASNDDDSDESLLTVKFHWFTIGSLDLCAFSENTWEWHMQVKEKWISYNDKILSVWCIAYVNNRWLVDWLVGRSAAQLDMITGDYWLIIHFTTKTKNSAQNMTIDIVSRIVLLLLPPLLLLLLCAYRHVYVRLLRCKSTQFSVK